MPERFVFLQNIVHGTNIEKIAVFMGQFSINNHTLSTKHNWETTTCFSQGIFLLLNDIAFL